MSALSIRSVVIAASISLVACVQVLGIDGDIAVTPPAAPAEEAGTNTDPDGGGGTTTPEAAPVCTPPFAQVCSMSAQCGCPDGQSCVLNEFGANKCATAGVGGVHARCNASTDCAVGLDCLNGLCAPFCETDAGCPAAAHGWQCLAPFSYAQQARYCVAKCNPLDAQAACGPAGTCNIGVINGTTISYCAAAGNAAGPAACSAQQQLTCAVGHVCLPDGSCRKWCRVPSSATDCPVGQTCTPSNPALIFAGTEYGVCG